MTSSTRTHVASKWCQAQEAAALVKDGDHVVVAGCGAPPINFLNALAERQGLTGVIVHHATAWGDLPHFKPSHTGYGFNAYFVPLLARGAVDAGAFDYIPLTFSQMARLFERGSLHADVVVATGVVDENGQRCSLGGFLSYLPAALLVARVKVLESSPNFSWVGGEALMSTDDFDVLVSSSQRPVHLPAPGATAATNDIAKHVAGLVSNGCTIQVGRGSLPNAIASELRDRRGLRVHSEMVSDWLVELSSNGCLASEEEAGGPPVVTAFMDGSSDLYTLVDGNPLISMRAIYDVNSPAVLSSIPDFVAINSAVEIDLTGQVNAEVVGGRLLGGSGGLLDFAFGAGLAKGGKFVIAMPSTARGDEVSRIVPQIAAPGVVSLPRTLVDYVVTEYGVVELSGLTLRERAERLIEIAHPKFQASLKRFRTAWSDTDQAEHRRGE